MDTERCPRCYAVGYRPTWTVYPILDKPCLGTAIPLPLLPRVRQERYGCMACDPEPWKR